MKNVTRIRWTNNSYIQFVNNLHKNKYDYRFLCYKGLNEKITIICPNHGQFEQFAGHHKNGKGCPKCAFEKQSKRQRDTTSSFIKKAQIVHNYKFNFSNTIYGKNAHEKVDIECPIHGIFNISPNSFLTSKHGCQKCAQEEATAKMIENQRCSWKKSDWIKICEGKIAKFYVIRLYNEEEEFYKIGITSKEEIKRRFTTLPYKYEIVKVIESSDAAFIFDFERMMLKNLKHVRYEPLIKFQGHTECIKSINSIKNFIN